ncbi:retrovirus-related pol polyprotein from transposon TNT 1-94 [Tanacetum coccineum]
MFKLDLEPLAPKLLRNRDAHIAYLRTTQGHANIFWEIVEQAKGKQPLDTELDFACKYATRIQELLIYVHDTCLNAIKPSAKEVAVTPLNKVKKVMFAEPLTSSNNTKQIVLWISSPPDASKQHDKNRLLMNFVSQILVLLDSRDTNSYTISLDDMLKSTPICLLSKASKTKSWLWHRRLSHLNFGDLNKLAKDGLARGLPRLKFQKDHLCSACALGKSKKSSHKPKAEDTNHEKLYLLLLDLC